jgi:hypothetical protein
MARHFEFKMGTWGRHIATIAACCQSTTLFQRALCQSWMFQAAGTRSFWYHKLWWTLNGLCLPCSYSHPEQRGWENSGSVPTQSFISRICCDWCKHPCHAIVLAVQIDYSAHFSSWWEDTLLYCPLVFDSVHNESLLLPSFDLYH